MLERVGGADARCWSTSGEQSWQRCVAGICLDAALWLQAQLLFSEVVQKSRFTRDLSVTSPNGESPFMSGKLLLPPALNRLIQ